MGPSGVTALPMAAPIYCPETDFNASSIFHGGFQEETA